MPEEKQTQAKTDSEHTAIPTLRTFQSETTDYIRQKNISLADMALAESKKQRLGYSPAKNFQKRKLIVIIGISIAALAAAGAFLWWQSQKKSSPITALAPPPLIFSESKEILEFSDREELISLLQNRFENPGIQSGQLKYLVPAEKIKNDGLVFLNGKKFLNLVASQAPEALINVLNEKFYLGTLKDDASGANSAIMIFEIKTFAQAFAAMLNWESSIKRDLSILVPEGVGLETGNAGFNDAIIKNQDARILKNINNQPVIIYAFFSKRFLVISSSQKAFEQTIIRLNQSLPLN